MSVLVIEAVLMKKKVATVLRRNMKRAMLCLFPDPWSVFLGRLMRWRVPVPRLEELCRCSVVQPADP